LVLVAGLLAAATPAVRAQEPEAISAKRALTLEECVGIALKSNPGLLAAFEQSEAARGRTKQARGALLPQVTGNADAFRAQSEERSSLVAGRSVPTPSNRYDEISAGVSLQQSVFSLSRWRTAGSASESQASAEAAYRTNQEEVVVATELAYYNYLKAIHLEEVSHENLKVGEEQLKLAEKRREVGIGVEADLLKARAQNAQDRLGVINAEKDTKLARTSLCHVMGISLDSPLVVEDIDPNEAVGAPPAPDVDSVLAERPDVVDQRHRVRAAELSYSAAKAERYPNLDFSFNYSWLLDAENTQYDVPVTDSAGVQIGTVDEIQKFNEYASWRAALGLTLPILRGGATRGRINEARANMRAEQELLAEAERVARLEIERATLNVSAAAEAITVSHEGVVAAEEDLRVSQGSYTHGLVPILNLVEAQAALVEAKNAHVSATYDYRMSLAQFQRAVGRGASKYAP
jgi:TolC family type I secretion outer membrane protein